MDKKQVTTKSTKDTKKKLFGFFSAVSVRMLPQATHGPVCAEPPSRLHTQLDEDGVPARTKGAAVRRVPRVRLTTALAVARVPRLRRSTVDVAEGNSQPLKQRPRCRRQKQRSTSARGNVSGFLYSKGIRMGAKIGHAFAILFVLF